MDLYDFTNLEQLIDAMIERALVAAFHPNDKPRLESAERDFKETRQYLKELLVTK